jgi:multiple sugar transport system permease protein
LKRRRGWVRPLYFIPIAALFVLPLAFMAVGSLRTPGLPPPSGFEWLPDPLRFENYRSIFAFAPLWRYMLNSSIVAIVAVPLTVLVASWAGYAIVASRSLGRRLVIVSLIALVIPQTALWVPRFVLYENAGLTDNLLVLMLPALMATSPFYVLLFALAYSRIDPRLFEAARLEGLSPFGEWRRVAWPLGRAAVFAVAVLAFIFHWSNFIDPLLYLTEVDLYTLPLGLRALQTLDATNFPILLAASVFVTLPALIAFLAVQRAFFARTLEV